MAYTTVNDIKTYIGITGSSDDALLATLATTAQKAIDQHCDRTFEAGSDTTRYFDAERDVGPPPSPHRGHTRRSSEYRTLYLDCDLCQITSVTNGDADSTVLTTADYATEPRNRTPWYALTIKISSNNIWEWDTTPENAIEIVGRWGYSVTAPADIQTAAMILAAYYYRQRDVVGTDIDRPVATGDGIVMQAQQIPPTVKSILQPYRRIV